MPISTTRSSGGNSGETAARASASSRHGALGEHPDEVVFAVEVAVERRRGEPEAPGDLAEREVDGAALGVDVARGVEDLFARLDAAPLAVAEAVIGKDGAVMLGEKGQTRLARGLMGRSAPVPMLISHRASPVGGRYVLVT